MKLTKIVWLSIVMLSLMIMTTFAQNSTSANSIVDGKNSTNPSSTIENKNMTITANATITTPPPTPTNGNNNQTTTVVPNSDDNSLPLHTIINPAFAILGASLILTGLPLAFIGHRCTWYVAFISGFYSSSMIVLCLILRFGQARAVNDPSNTVEGLFVLACFCAGIIGGILFIVFRQGALLITCAFGGFAFSLFLQACRSNGLIEILGYRYLLFIAFISLCFALACHSRLHHYLIIFSTSIIGSSATILGIDCFIRANLKEFYIRNIGFDDLFVTRYPNAFANERWPLSPAMVIELGVLAGCFVMAIALQGKLWVQLKASIQIMKQQDQERQERERLAEGEAKNIFAKAQQDLRFWKQANKESLSEEGLESQNLTPSTTTALQRFDTFYDETTKRSKDTPQIELPPQNSGILSPNLANCLGLSPSSVEGFTEEPKLDIDHTTSSDIPTSDPISEEIREKERYLEQIAAIRKSIHDLRSNSPGNSTIDLNFRRSSFLDPDSNLHSSVTTMPVRGTKRLSLPEITPVKVVPADMQNETTINKQGQRSNSDAGRMKTIHWSLREKPQPIEKVQEESHSLGEFAVLSGSKQSLLHNLSSTIGAERPQSMMLVREEQNEQQQSAILPASTSERRRVQSMFPFPTTSSSKEKLIVSQDRIIIGAPSYSHFTSKESVGSNLPPPIPAKAMLRQMTGNELQARHNKRLSALQKPLSDKVNQEAALTQAKQEWQKRKTDERKRWQMQEQQRLNGTIGR